MNANTVDLLNRCVPGGGVVQGRIDNADMMSFLLYVTTHCFIHSEWASVYLAEGLFWDVRLWWQEDE